MARGLQQIKADLIAADKAGNREAIKALQTEWYAAKAAAARSQEAARAPVTPEIGNPERGTTGIAEGTGSMLTNIGRRAVNLALPKSLEPSFATDEAIQTQKELDAPLSNSVRGSIGQAAGAVIGLSPVTAATNLARGTTALSRAMAASRTARLGVPAAEGAVSGELTDGNAGVGALYNVGASGTGALLSKAIRGRTRTAEAQRLLDKGIDLTPGQMRPSGTWAQLEETSTSFPIIGRPVDAARASAKTDVLDKLLEMSTGKAPTAAKFSDAIEDAANSFGQRYQAAQGFPVNTNLGTLRSEWQGIVGSPGILASNDARNRVGRVLQNQLTAIPPKPTTDDLLKVRSTLRSMARSARKSATSMDEREIADMLGDAAEALTPRIESALPAQAAQALKAVDADYAKFKVLETAFYQSGVRGEPTLREVGTALKRTMSTSQWAKGRGGATRELVEDAAQALETKAPATGARVLTTLGKYGVLPTYAVGAAATVPGVRHAVQGRTPVQRALQKSLNDPVMQDIVSLLRANRVPAVGALTAESE